VLAAVVLGLCANLSADKALNAKIDSLLKSLGRASTRKVAREQLNAIGAPAIPRLIQHVKGSSLAMRAMALSALQTCWSPEALDAVTGALVDRNKTVRDMAHSALRLNLSGDELSAAMSKLADSRSVLIAGPALQSSDRAAPDAARMARALARSGMWKYLDRVLPRYHSPTLTPAARKMLDRGAIEQKITAICGLIHQQDNSPQTRAKIAKRLRLGTPRLRAMAAEYMRWHGGQEDLDALKNALKGERDVYCRAALDEAVAAIGRRAELFKDAPDTPSPKWPDEPTKAYRTAIDLLKKHPTRSARASVLKLLASAEPFEPLHYYRGRSTTAGAGRNSARFELLTLVSGYPAVRQDATYHLKDSPPPATQPSAMKLMPPVRDYFDPKRKSFGSAVSGAKGPFSGTYHVGDDVAWHRPQSTVVAIGDGEVKIASVGVASWGGFVVIEHTGDKSGPFCSLYGHLGPLVCVRPGRKVRRGQKIASLGRSFTWTNGGYGTHLHFGIRKGLFSRGGFTGYLPPAKFKSGAAGWTDPQKFVRARLK
jgi:murein DD-endopeptidase MepM/ murein hydrolase activator NlpD